MKLEGLKVVDLSWFLPGPYLTTALADHGAEVIKVEAPGAGDPGRGSELHTVLGQAKQAIVLDLKKPEAVAIARDIKPSPRGELEITDLNRVYLERGALQVERLGRGIAWLDTGNAEALLKASVFIEAVEERTGVKIACLEEIALRVGFIDAATFAGLAEQAPKSVYGEYLRRLVRTGL